MQLRQQLLDLIDRLDDVGAGLALDVEDDAGRVLFDPGRRRLGVLGALR